MEGPFKIILQEKVFDPFINLASEEYLLEQQKRNYESNILFVYRNSPSIVCGKNQSIWAEANLKYCREKEILLNKRVSGGGTVYHDMDNLNFAFFTPRKSEWVSNFSVFNAPIIDFLKTHKIDAYSNARNDILIDNFKISGNAQHLSGAQMISHATLLFDANLENVSSALRHPFTEVHAAAIESKKVPVTNIRKYGLNMNTDGFLALFIREMEKALSCKVEYGFDKKAQKEIEKLAQSKYKSDAWIYGNSPKTTVKMELVFDNKNFEISCHLEKGKVSAMELFPDSQGLKILLDELLTDQLFTFQNLQKKILSSENKNQKELKEILDSLNI